MQMYPFEKEKLAYEYYALEPFIDRETVDIHYNKHYGKYVDTLNEILRDYPVFQKYSLEELILNYKKFPNSISEKIKNNAGGVYNHMLYFRGLADKKTYINEKLKNEIIKQYGSIENFKNMIIKVGKEKFASGYVWVMLESDRKIKIRTSDNQDVPLGALPLMLIDVWEHSYYLKYKYDKEAYMKNILNVINYDLVNDLYEKYCGMYNLG